MDAGDLEIGFRLGDWVLEPRLGRISGNGRSHSLSFHHIRILKLLAERHGEVVERGSLRDSAWPCQHSTDEMLRTAVRELREILGDSSRDPRYIVRVSRRGYALIAHVEPLAQPSRAVPAIDPTSIVVESRLIARTQKLVSELRRRSVFKVLGAYLLGMWIALQVAQTTFEPLHLPGWWMTALTILAVIGIPIVAMLAWSYEITPGGIALDAGDKARVQLPHARRAIAPLLVTGVAMMAGVTGLAWWKSIADTGKPALEAAEPAAHSIAVLPFVDMSPGGGNAYLGDGFAEEISSQLAKVPGLRVAARTSAFEFKDRNLDVRRIGEALGVHHVLEGSIRRDGDDLRVTVQLIDALNGYHVWAGTYDEKWADAIAVQDDIARKIAQGLEVVLTPDTESRLRRAGVVSLDAYDSYLAGVSAVHASGDLSQLNKAEGLFRKALSLDPGLARAYAGLCEVALKRYDRTSATADVVVAEQACHKALKLEPSHDETEMALARLYLDSGRSEQAEAVYGGLAARRADDADVFIGLGYAQLEQGRREDAGRSFHKAIEVEPGYWQAYSALGNYFFRLGRAEDAIGAYRRATELAPGSASAFSNLGAALLLAVRLDEAAAAFEKSLAIEPSRSAHANLGSLYYFLGRFPEAVRQYESAERIASDDQQVAGALADALWQMPGRRADAVRQYERAARLAEDALKVNPSHAVTWAQLGLYSGRAGDPSRAARALARAEALGEEENYVYYYIALAASDRRDRAAAEAGIERALELGYPRKLLEVDPVLKTLLPDKKA
jgi:TolB-like protein/Flp pilus assembly protein TadD/DNA-binding winged helix-turn-helix (wHTH) protein